eukprot:3800228-Prorocentrum_lima.AAC.1
MTEQKLASTCVRLTFKPNAAGVISGPTWPKKSATVLLLRMQYILRHRGWSGARCCQPYWKK